MALSQKDILGVRTKLAQAYSKEDVDSQEVVIVDICANSDNVAAAIDAIELQLSSVGINPVAGGNITVAETYSQTEKAPTSVVGTSASGAQAVDTGLLSRFREKRAASVNKNREAFSLEHVVISKCPDRYTAWKVQNQQLDYQDSKEIFEAYKALDAALVAAGGDASAPTVVAAQDAVWALEKSGKACYPKTATATDAFIKHLEALIAGGVTQSHVTDATKPAAMELVAKLKDAATKDMPFPVEYSYNIGTRYFGYRAMAGDALKFVTLKGMFDILASSYGAVIYCDTTATKANLRAVKLTALVSETKVMTSGKSSATSTGVSGLTAVMSDLNKLDAAIANHDIIPVNVADPTSVVDVNGYYICKEIKVRNISARNADKPVDQITPSPLRIKLNTKGFAIKPNPDITDKNFSIPELKDIIDSAAKTGGRQTITINEAEEKALKKIMEFRIETGIYEAFQKYAANPDDTGTTAPTDASTDAAVDAAIAD